MAFPNLLRPLQIGPHTLKDRVLMSALTRSRSVPTNVPNGLNLEYYAQRARGGAGLITTEGTLVVPQGSEWQNAPGIWSKEQVAAWKKITDAVHAEGSIIFNQAHLASHPDAPEQLASGLPVYAPSAKAARGGKFRFLPGRPGYVTPTEVPDPTILIEQFRQAAINAKEAGFDGVELHGANGYLVQQFLDSTANQRTDKWGGSVENRCRFGLEVLKVLVSIWGSKRVAVRLNPAGGYNDIGMSLEETLATYKHFISEADNMDLAYITLIRYSAMLDPVIDGELRATQHDESLLKEAEALIAQNKIDAAVFGMLWISHPDLAKRLEHGVPLDNQIEFTKLYGLGPEMTLEELKKGYTDYPAYHAAQEKL
ncbi:hypothetical protein BU15DRAFT_69713 [Melanogaster broomeanus]|nr:hypothetical protein BU15DRAFT_69713 [Melanogaster broomeanus]